MHFVKILILLLGTVVLSGLLALSIAFGIASLGLLGTCAEGACEYAALFLVFPALWLGLLAAAAIGYGAHWRRTRQE
jgi:hypothetical protein